MVAIRGAVSQVGSRILLGYSTHIFTFIQRSLCKLTKVKFSPFDRGVVGHGGCEGHLVLAGYLLPG